MTDLGFTHIALPATDLDATIAFYREFAGFKCVSDRTSSGVRVIWLSDGTRPFVIVFVQTEKVDRPLGPFAHLGVAIKSREEVDRLASLARERGVPCEGPEDHGPPIGYWAFLKDPDGHTLELAYGQDVEQAVDKFSPDGRSPIA